jgi:hypothetical protein
MTRSTAATKGTGTRDTTTRVAIPAPRRSPEERPEPDEPQSYDAYPGVRYALEHATALQPRPRTS